jgi:hypothetical protein
MTGKNWPREDYMISDKDADGKDIPG